MNSTIEKNRLIITLPERIDAVNVRDIETEFEQIIEKAPSHEAIILDAKELVYISSAALRLLIRLRENQPVPLILVNVSPQVYEIFDITGFTEILEIHT